MLCVKGWSRWLSQRLPMLLGLLHFDACRHWFLGTPLTHGVLQLLGAGGWGAVGRGMFFGSNVFGGVTPSPKHSRKISRPLRGTDSFQRAWGEGRGSHHAPCERTGGRWKRKTEGRTKGKHNNRSRSSPLFRSVAATFNRHTSLWREERQ